MRDLCACYSVDIASFCRDLCMDWQEIVEMAADPLVTIGAHTVNHKMLKKVPDDDAVRAEMEMSRAVLEAALGKRPNHLAYPVGDPTSAGPREFRIAAELGFKTAVTTRPGVLFKAHRDHLTALPRISVNGEFQQQRYLKVLMSGAGTAFWNGFRRGQRGLRPCPAIRPRHPLDQQHRRQHPAEAGHHVIDRRHQAVDVGQHRLRQRHGDEAPDRHQHEQGEGADQLAGAHGHCRASLHVICSARRRDYMVRAVPSQASRFMKEPTPVPVHNPHAVRLWLLCVAAMIFLTLVVGGATRLTEIGPVDHRMEAGHRRGAAAVGAAWQAEFKAYQAIPQYKELNRGMSLDQFKVIYWWEWTHRLLARSTGAVFLLPFLFFLWRGWVPPRLKTAAVDAVRRRRLSGRGRLVDGVVGARRLRTRQRVAVPAGLSSDARHRDLCRRSVDRAADRAAAADRSAGAAALRRAGDRRAGAAADLSRRAGRRPRRRSASTIPGR